MDVSRTGPPSDGADPRNLSELGEALEREHAVLARELDEIELLLTQTRTEAERHEARRAQAAARLPTLEADPRSTQAALQDARTQLLTQTRRATLMEAQVEVLQGKQRGLQRFVQHLEETLPRLRQLAAGAGDGGQDGLPAPGSREILAAQEEMRREIARQMHDGPAQSIANIALQAQVVQRLYQRDPERAEAELQHLTEIVQHALEATKNFIFDVRPMVLDDLGLVPTLRRACLEHTRREEIPVRFESAGTDRRLDRELESTVFRILEDALTGFLAGQPAGLLVRLDWADEAVRASVHSPATGVDEVAVGQVAAAKAAEAAVKRVPDALAAMIREREESAAATEAALRRAQGLPPQVWADIRSRAATIGIQVELKDEGRLLEVMVPTAA